MIGLVSMSKKAIRGWRLFANGFSCGGQMTGDAALNFGLKLFFAVCEWLPPNDRIDKWCGYAPGLYMVHHQICGNDSG